MRNNELSAWLELKKKLEGNFLIGRNEWNRKQRELETKFYSLKILIK